MPRLYNASYFQSVLNSELAEVCESILHENQKMKFLCDVGNFFYTQVHILSEQLIMILCGLRLSSCFGDSLVVILLSCVHMTMICVYANFAYVSKSIFYFVFTWLLRVNRICRKLKFHSIKK